MIISKLKIQDDDMLILSELMKATRLNKFSESIKKNGKFFPDYGLDQGVFFQKKGKEKFLIFTDRKILIRKKLNYSKCKTEEDFIFLPFIEVRSTLDYRIDTKRKNLKFKCNYKTTKGEEDVIGKLYIPDLNKILNLEYEKKFTKQNFLINSKIYSNDIMYHFQKELVDINYLNKVIKFFSEKFIFYSFREKDELFSGIETGKRGYSAPIYFYNKSGNTEAWLMPFIK
jgi:hypothetical protein